MPITFEEAAEGRADDIRNLRDVVDLGFTRGCSRKTWRDKDAEGEDPQSLEPSQKACSMNIYQDYYGGQDLQFEDPIRKEKGVKRVASVNDRPGAARFELDSNVFRRGNTVAHPKSEMYVSGCLGGDANVGGSLNDRGSSAPGFIDYTNIAPIIHDTGERCQDRSLSDCRGTDNHCIADVLGGACKSGLHDGASHSIGNLYFGSDDKGPHDTHVKASSLYCDRGDGVAHLNPQVAKQHVRGTYVGDRGEDGADPGWQTRRACCLGAGTFQQGALEGEYKASSGKRPLGAPCKTDSDCWDGEDGGTIFCDNRDTLFYEGSKEHMANRPKVGLKSIRHPATFTCKRRCGPAGKVSAGHEGNTGRFENVSYDYGTTFIGTSFGDAKTVADARLRSKIAISAAQLALITFPGAAALLGAGVAEAINAGYIGPMEEESQRYVTGSNLNAFECGFQQRPMGDKAGENLYYNPVFERADKHDDRVDSFLCLSSGKRYEYESVGPASCYGHEKGAWGFACQEKCGYGGGLDLEWELSPNPAWYQADGEYPSRRSRGFCEDRPSKVLQSVEGKRACEERGQTWVVTDPGDSLPKTEYTDEHMFMCKERCLPHETVSSFGNKCMHNCSRGPSVDVDNGSHIKIGKFEELTHCPFPYDSNDSDAFWDRVAEARARCDAFGAGETSCLMERQERGAEDREARERCDACLRNQGEEGVSDFTEEGMSMCGRECSRYLDIPSVCRFEDGACSLRPMKEFDDVYPVHNDFLSANENPDTGRRGDGAGQIVLRQERCFYSGFPDQCFEATTETDALGYAERRLAALRGDGESGAPSSAEEAAEHRQKDAMLGMFREDGGCLPGWSETFPGVCSKDCAMHYRRGLVEVEEYCKEDESVRDAGACEGAGLTWVTGDRRWIDDQVGSIVGWGYSGDSCADCSGVDKDDAEAMRACRERCNLVELPDCASKDEGSCQVPGTGCRWNHSRSVCYDPTYKVEHESAWLGLVCTEKCGTSINHGLHDPNRSRSVEFCPDKSKCTERGALNRCYQPCASDQKEGAMSFLCQDSCERHMITDPDGDEVQENSGRCMMRNEGVADRSGESVYRPADTQLFRCESGTNGRVFWDMNDCLRACDAGCSTLDGRDAIAMGRLEEEEIRQALDEALASPSGVDGAKKAAVESAPFLCTNADGEASSSQDAFMTRGECEQSCEAPSACERRVFQCSKDGHAYGTMQECAASCAAGDCSRVSSVEASAKVRAVVEAEQRRAESDAASTQAANRRKDAAEKARLTAEVDGVMEARDRQAEARFLEEKEASEDRMQELMSRSAAAAASENAKRMDIPDRPSGGEMKSGLGCAANGDGPRRPFFRTYRRVRQIAGVCWEDAPSDCTKCEHLGKEPCQDSELLAANACQKGEVEDGVRIDRLRGAVCSRVVTAFESRDRNAAKGACNSFEACRWEEEECKVDPAYSPAVGADVVVGSGVSWKEDWREILKDEEAKGEGVDEMVQGINRVGGVPHLRRAVILELDGDAGLAKVKYEDGEFYDPRETMRECIDEHRRDFESGRDCCSCDSGLWNDVRCADAIADNAPNWGDDFKESVKSWHYDGLMCKSNCPPGTKWDFPSFFCNQTCDDIISDTKEHCESKTGSSDAACAKHKWEGLDGSRHVVCRRSSSGDRCESIFQGKWKEGAIPGTCYKQGNEVTKTRGKNYGWAPWAIFDCEKDHGKGKCNWTAIGVFEGCRSKHGEGWTEGFAPGLCYRIEPRDFTSASMGGSLPIAQWLPTQGKRAFVAKTHIKANYGPVSWMPSTYPKMRSKASFFPVQRPRRGYAPPVRAKKLDDPSEGYTTGKARNAWWWDRQMTDAGSEKACFQGCDDALGQSTINEEQCSLDEQVCIKCCKGSGKRSKSEGGRAEKIPDDECGEESVRGVWDAEEGKCTFPGAGEEDVLYGPRGCIPMKKKPGDSILESAKALGEYTYPPLCRAHWTPGKPALDMVRPYVCSHEANEGLDGKVYTSLQMCRESCEKDPNKDLLQVIGLKDSRPVGKCAMVADMDAKEKQEGGGGASPAERVGVRQWVDSCGEFFVGKEDRTPDGKNRGGWCMEFVEDSRAVALDGLCAGSSLAAPEGKEASTFCQKSRANCEDACTGGEWKTNLKEVAGTIVAGEKLFPPISGLGEVVGYTRNDKNVLLLPFALPRSIRVGADAKGKPAMREILLTMDDGGEERVFRVAKRSLDYDRMEAATCIASGSSSGPLARVMGESSEQECRDACDRNDQCAAFDWNVDLTCTLFGKDASREEDATMSSVCSMMRPNPSIARNDLGEAIGYNVRIEPVDAQEEGMREEIHLLDVKDDVGGVAVPIPYERNPGRPRRLGIVGTKNAYRMRRYQASSLHGGDICRNWMFDRHGNNEDILGADERSPLYRKMCDDYQEDCPSGDCSLLNSAIQFCNTRVDSARANSDLEMKIRMEKERKFHTWTDGECSDPSITSKGVCEGTRRKGMDAAEEGDVQANLERWRSQQMLEDVPRCLPDTFSAFDLPARSCPRWSADGAQGSFCRQLRDEYPLQYDRAIHSFCKDPSNALLPACDCLAADVVASERRSKDPRSLEYCSAALGAEKADNYADRVRFCKSKQMLASGSTSLEGAMNDHKFTFLDKCQDTLDAPQILKPQFILSTQSNACKVDAQDLPKNVCGAELSTCVEQQPMPDMCVNVINQTVNNCIIASGSGPCAVIDSVSQQNNCCAGENEEKCREINIQQSSVKNKIMLNPEAAANRRAAPILPESDGIYRCDGGLAEQFFTSEEDCGRSCDSECILAYEKNAGSTFAAGLLSDLSFSYDPTLEEDPAVAAANKCAETDGCTGFAFSKAEAGDWLQYTLTTEDSPELRNRHGSTTFLLA